MNRTRAGLLAAVSSLALVSPVAAADMPLKARPPVVIAPSWAGAYIGASVGAVWHELDYEDLTGTPPNVTARGRKAGIIGGGHIGYNWQSNNFVFGVEADISGSSAKVTLQPFGPGNEIDTGRLHWLATFRARAGVTVGRGNTLLFATGGLALGGVENLRTLPPEVGEGKATRVGWVAGGGIEHMLSRNWIVRAEALYVDLGSETVVGPPPNANYRTRFTNTDVIARGAVLFKW
jgi:outer membrane immunogenic protein